MRWWVVMGLLILAVLDVTGALLLSPTTAAVFVADPVRPEGVLWLRALFAVGPGVALAGALALTCGIASLGVALRQPWGKPLGGILAALHLPWVLVSVPLLLAVRGLPEPAPQGDAA